MGSGGGTRGTALRWAALASAVMALLLYVPTPYVIYEPGLTLPVAQLAAVGVKEAGAGDEQVTVDADNPEAPGSWAMTTVYMASRTNYWQVIQTGWRQDREAHNRKKVLGGSSSKEYAARMNVMMAGSQSNAVEAAYRAAGIGYESVERGGVRDIVPADPAHAVAVQAGSIGGPSAGLAFALYIFDALTPGDLTGGRQVTATGAISPSGEVSAVGGVGMKAIAAARSGAELFLVPAGNEAEARAKAASIGANFAVEGVATLQEAIGLLEQAARS